MFEEFHQMYRSHTMQLNQEKPILAQSPTLKKQSQNSNFKADIDDHLLGVSLGDDCQNNSNSFSEFSESVEGSEADGDSDRRMRDNAQYVQTIPIASEQSIKFFNL